MSNVCFRTKEIMVLLFGSEFHMTVCLSLYGCVCVGQGIQGAPGLPGIRGKPGPQVSFGYNNQEYIKTQKCGNNGFHLNDLFGILGELDKKIDTALSH